MKYSARVKNTGEFETKELAEKARFETDSDSFIEWKAIFRQLKGNWALENNDYKSGSMDMPADLKNTPDGWLMWITRFLIISYLLLMPSLP